MAASHRSSTWLLLAGAAWAMGFAVVHLYWAAGGRAGVPAGAGAIGARPWFLAYDLVAAAALAAAAVTGVALAAGWGGAGRRRWLRRAAVAGALVALLRGGVGVVQDVVLAVTDGPGPGVGAIYDVWFAAAGVLFLPAALRLRRERASRDR